MKPIVSEQELKSLKLFSYYLQSHGIKLGSVDCQVEYCQLDHISEYAYGNGSRAELYDAITETFKSIIKNNNLDELDDCEHLGSISLDVDCTERTLTVVTSEYVLDTENQTGIIAVSDIKDEELVKSLTDFFNEIRKNDTKDSISFYGGGDDGSINDTTNNGLDIPSDIVDFLYNWLSNDYGGWEINEGGQGDFIFNTDNEEIEIFIGINEEVSKEIDRDFQIKF